jgi:hypothetical protein
MWWNSTMMSGPVSKKKKLIGGNGGQPSTGESSFRDTRGHTMSAPTAGARM